MDNINIAIEYAERIQTCKTEEELLCIRREIQAQFDKDPVFKKEWKEWLATFKEQKMWEMKNEIQGEPLENSERP